MPSLTTPRAGNLNRRVVRGVGRPAGIASVAAALDRVVSNDTRCARRTRPSRRVDPVADRDRRAPPRRPDVTFTDIAADAARLALEAGRRRSRRRRPGPARDLDPDHRVPNAAPLVAERLGPRGPRDPTCAAPAPGSSPRSTSRPARDPLGPPPGRAGDRRELMRPCRRLRRPPHRPGCSATAPGPPSSPRAGPARSGRSGCAPTAAELTRSSPRGSRTWSAWTAQDVPRRRRPAGRGDRRGRGRCRDRVVIDLFVYHQANGTWPRSVSLRLDPDLVVDSISNHGNTSAASVPIALDAVAAGASAPAPASSSARSAPASRGAAPSSGGEAEISAETGEVRSRAPRRASPRCRRAAP